MSKIVELSITQETGKEMEKMKILKLIAGKGILTDRYFKENNYPEKQITLIESENIDLFNQKLGTKNSYIDFRRNVITKNVALNNLIGKKFYLGKVLIKGIILCEPCKYLQDKLKNLNLVKTLVHRGGLRCEILTNGEIKVNDEIKL
tara:strand:+ start:63 stop:503 length:441 start_codon:yes stop_codon:yes gene_type:complete